MTFKIAFTLLILGLCGIGACKIFGSPYRRIHNYADYSGLIGAFLFIIGLAFLVIGIIGTIWGII